MANVDQEKTKTASPSTTFSMTQGTREPPAPICFPKFATTQQATLFNKLKNNQFSGKVSCQTEQGRESHIYCYLGRIIYVTGGTHPVRRWRRSVLKICPKRNCSPQQKSLIEKHYKQHQLSQQKYKPCDLA